MRPHSVTQKSPPKNLSERDAQSLKSVTMCGYSTDADSLARSKSKL